VQSELAAIAAAIIHGYSHIVTDGLILMHQNKKQLSHPDLHHHHIQVLRSTSRSSDPPYPGPPIHHIQVLRSIAKAIHQSPSPIHFHKVKFHAGITGCEYADALAMTINDNLL
jgi:hypothetical protein